MTHKIRYNFVVVSFISSWRIHRIYSSGYFPGTGAIVRLPQCQWSNPEEYRMGLSPKEMSLHYQILWIKSFCLSPYYDVLQGLDSIWRLCLPSTGNPIVEIRRYYDRLISTTGFPLLVRRHLYIESEPSNLWTEEFPAHLFMRVVELMHGLFEVCIRSWAFTLTNIEYGLDESTETLLSTWKRTATFQQSANRKIDLLFLMEDKDTFIACSQYHDCWLNGTWTAP